MNSTPLDTAPGYLSLGCDTIQADPPRTLLLHGFAGCAADWAQCWTGDAPAIALDLPGHGSSPDPSGSWDTAIGRLLDELPQTIDRVVGYSLGGRIALGLLRAAPLRFRSAVIVSAHPGLRDPAERAQRRIADRHWIDLLEREGIDAFVCEWESQPLFASQSRLPPEILTSQRTRRLSHRAAGLAASLKVFGLGEMPDSWSDMQRFPGELRWIVGTDDRKFAEIAYRARDLRPATELHLLDGAGHNLLLETPGRLGSLLACTSAVRYCYNDRS
jgi:2-succinyl-6-hydroxy-2,4-cyclohexadiene-1-carboxylate synthase